MAKKGFGKFIAFAAIAGAVAAGISYLTKYKSFHKELEEDFHDFEDNDKSETPADNTMERSYVSLNAEKPELSEAVDSVVSSAKEAVQDAVEAVSDTAEDVVEDAKKAVTTIVEDTIES